MSITNSESSGTIATRMRNRGERPEIFERRLPESGATTLINEGLKGERRGRNSCEASEIKGLKSCKEEM
jgi:hypothetical protein